jgi:hypothetical protein
LIPSRPGVIWDACGLLNLVVTGHAPAILASLGCPSYVIPRLRVGEVYFMRPLPEDDPLGRLVPIDLTPLLDARFPLDVELGRAEQELYAEFALTLDDGEALTCAVAAVRRLWMASDDRAAIRLATSLPVPVPVWTTPEWLKHWADADRVATDMLRDVLRRVHLCARYIPPRSHSLRDWWNGHLTSL